MANVTMDLAELKQLEDTIKTLTTENEDLISKQAQVVVYHKFFKGKLRPNPASSNHGLTIHGIRSTTRWDTNMGYPQHTENHFIDEVSISDLIRRDLITVDVTELTDRTTKDYLNLSEVQRNITEEVDLEYRDKIKALGLRAAKAEELSQSAKEDYHKKAVRLQKKIEDKLEASNDAHLEDAKNAEKIIDKLRQDYRDLKEDKERLSLEDTIKKLTDELEAMTVKLEAAKTPRSFFGKLIKG